MTYMLSTIGSKWPRLEIEEVDGKVVFTVWQDENTMGPQFETTNRHDLELIKNTVSIAQMKQSK